MYINLYIHGKYANFSSAEICRLFVCSYWDLAVSVLHSPRHLQYFSLFWRRGEVLVIFEGSR